MIYDIQPNIREINDLEKSYHDELFWIDDNPDIVKGRPAAPIGTIKNLNGTEYIKTPEGWRYHTSASRKKAQGHYSKNNVAMPAGLDGDISGYRKNNGGHSSNTVKEGSKITAPDGTVGEVVGRDGFKVLVKYKSKEGQEITASVDAKVLEDRVASGMTKHTGGKDNESHPQDDDSVVKRQAESEDRVNTQKHAELHDKKEGSKNKEGEYKKSPLQTAHKEYILEALRKGTSIEDIIAHLEKFGVDTKQIREFIKDSQHEQRGFNEKKGDVDVTGKSEKIKKSDDIDIYNGGLTKKRAEIIKASYQDDMEKR